MSTPRLASVFAAPPVYAAGRAARAYAVPGAATRRRAAQPVRGLASPAIIFLSGLAAGMALVVALSGSGAR